jgi:hypothetical protein
MKPADALAVFRELAADPGGIYLSFPLRVKILDELQLSAEQWQYSEYSPHRQLFARYLHSFFASSDLLVPVVLRFCILLERASPRPLAAAFRFDLLIATQIATEPPADHTAARGSRVFQGSSGKFAACEYFLLLLRLGRLPGHLIRSLIASYTDETKVGRERVAAYLCECLIRFPRSIEVPELVETLVRVFVETGSETIAMTFAYCLEMDLGATRDLRVFRPLFCPLTCLDATARALKAGVQVANCVTALQLLLRTWPGMLGLGVHDTMVQWLIRCLPYQPDAVISIMRDIVRVKGPEAAITDPIAGLFLSRLFRHEIIENLSQMSQSLESVKQFMSAILPLVTHAETFGCDLVHAIFQASAPPPTKFVASLLLDFSPKPQQNSEITPEVIKANLKTIDEFIQRVGKSQIVLAEIAAAILKLEPTQRDLRKAPGLARLRDNIIEAVQDPQDLFDTPKWVYVQLYCVMITSPGGTRFLGDLSEGLDPSKIIPIWQKKGAEVFRKVLTELTLDSMTQDLFLNCLQTESDDIHMVVMHDLKRRRKTMGCKDFGEVLATIIQTHLMGLPKSGREAQAKRVLNFVGEVLYTDELVRAEVARNEMFVGALRDAHFVMVLLLSEDCLDPRVVAGEVAWWMETGIDEYVKLYDLAIQAVFTGRLADIQMPAIYNFDGSTIVPRHLFGELAKTDAGRNKLSPIVDSLVMRLDEEKSIPKLRGIFFALGHFASVSEPMAIVEKLLKVESRFHSHVLRGTLIVALSLIPVTDELSLVVQKFDWEVFQFGARHSVIPSKFVAVLASSMFTFRPSLTPEPEESPDVVAAMKTNPGSLLLDGETPKDIRVAQYAHSLLGSFEYSALDRNLILQKV